MSRFRFDARRNRWLSACLLGSGVLAFVPLSASGQDIKPETLERVKRAAVMVFTAASQESQGDRPLGSGSGYFINGSGMLITNNHVVSPWHGLPPAQAFRMQFGLNKLTWTVITDSGTDDEKTWKCRMIYQNEPADQAILQALDEDEALLETPDYLRLLPSSRLDVREQIWAIGFPGGDRQRTIKDKHPEVTVTRGRITDLPRKASGRIEMIWTDVHARGGNSGGAMVNRDGFVVGTVTLGTFDAEGRANATMLVPADLTRRFVHNAFLKSNVASQSDFTPFMDILTTETGRINVPEFSRLKDQEVLFFEEGDRIHGAISTEKITWNSDIGTIVVPLDAVAYVMSDDEGSNLYLEGGNRIAASEAGSSFKFKPVGGDEIDQDLDEVRVVSFRTSDRRLEPVTGEVVVFDSDLAYLVLTTSGDLLKFESNNAGIIEIRLNQIARIETTPDEDQLLVTTNGQRITGMSTDDPINARIAATGLSIRFHLSEIGSAVVEIETRGLNDVAGLGLQGVLAKADRDIRRLADQVDALDLGNVRAKILEQMESPQFKGFQTARKDHLRLLKGVAALRSGDYDVAIKNLRRCSRSRVSNMRAYSKACLDVLKRFDGYQFDSKPLSNRLAFAAAGALLTDETLEAVTDFLKYAPRYQHLKPDEFRRGFYARNLARIRRYELDMTTADVLGGIEAENQLHRLWALAINSSEGEKYRLRRAIEKEEESEQGRTGGNRRAGRGRGSRQTGGSQLASQRKIDDLNEALEKVHKTQDAYEKKQEEAGFRIEDPDIDVFRRAQDDDGP